MRRRNRREKDYKTVIGILLIIIILQGLFIFSRHPQRKAVWVPPEAPGIAKGKIAIVIDDWGYSVGNYAIARRIKYPLTMAILPNLAFSTRIAKRLYDLGFEVILHLPMEPEDEASLEKNTLLVSMNEAETSEIINRDLDNIKYCRGVSNHMGSKLTVDRGALSAVFKSLKKRGLYFLDSYVTSGSICCNLARQTGLRFARRDIFLDNESDPKYIRGQINLLKAEASACGQAIGIGHDRLNTLKVLEEVMPEMEKEGYKFVFVSELVN